MSWKMWLSLGCLSLLKLALVLIGLRRRRDMNTSKMPLIDVSIYLAHAMTGMDCADIWKWTINTAQKYEKQGIRVIAPAFGEGIPFINAPLPDRPDFVGQKVWKEKDKGGIRKANVLVVTLPENFSQGVFWEGVYGRGVLWKATVIVCEGGVRPGFITRSEGDYVATSHEEAALLIRQKWGTKVQRIPWRLGMLSRSLPRWVLHQLQEFK